MRGKSETALKDRKINALHKDSDCFSQRRSLTQKHYGDEVVFGRRTNVLYFSKGPALVLENVLVIVIEHEYEV